MKPHRHSAGAETPAGSGISLSDQALYDRIALRWWSALTPAEREAWLDRAEADGRERSPVAAYALMGDMLQR
jgi:hypothetical protein